MRKTRYRHLTPTLVEVLVATQGNWCCYCCRTLSRPRKRGPRRDNERTIEHVVPVAKGGTTDLNNCRLACRACNLQKADMNLDEFLAIRGFEPRRKAQ